MMKRLSFWTFFFVISIGCNKANVRNTFSEDFDLQHRYKSQNTINKSKLSVATPEWLIVRPSNDLYYMGIGQANINDSNYAQLAKNRALAQVAEEISVTISSEMINTAVEISGMLESDFQEDIRTSTQKELEGVETVGFWQDHQFYWVYCRLNKAKYNERQTQKIDQAIQISFDLYQKATSQLNAGELANALPLYLQALLPIQNYLAQSLTVKQNQNSTIQLQDQIYLRIRQILGQIRISTDPPEISVKLGQPSFSQLKVIVESSKPLRQIPIRFSTISLSTDLMSTVLTDRNGVASIRINPKEFNIEETQIAEAKLDLSALIGFGQITSKYLEMLIEDFPVPTIKLIVKIIKPSICIKSVETNMGKSSSVSYVTEKIKEVLVDKGFTFKESVVEADFVINLHARTRAGSEVFGQFVAYADLTIAVTNTMTDQEIYHQGLVNIKGIHTNYWEAGLKALEKARNQINVEVTPNLLIAIQK